LKSSSDHEQEEKMSEPTQNSVEKFDRRRFLGVSAATAGVMLVKPELVFGTAANSALRVGLLGCGGRGTDDASTLIASANARVVALADLFEDQLQTAKAHFDQLQQAKGYPALESWQLFLGPHAYEEISAAQDVDAIVIATPPYFHPKHFEAAVTGGKHVYLEKPVAVDVPGALQVVEIGKRANGKLSLDVGFQIRDCPPFVELVRRIHNGAIGNIVCGEAHYLATYLKRVPHPNASPLELRIRNWIYDRALSGDIIVEQNIHVIDICNWILQSHPTKAIASGSRAGRPAGDGDVYGNYQVLFRYGNGVDVAFTSTQFGNNWPWDVTERFFGTKGISQSPYSGALGIWGDAPWQWSGPGTQEPQAFSSTGKFGDNLQQADPEKKKAFVESITSGNFHNQTEKGAESAISCMMAREAALHNREITWEEIINSQDVYDPKIDLNKLA
jgi:predicted dehydrogenase